MLDLRRIGQLTAFLASRGCWPQLCQGGDVASTWQVMRTAPAEGLAELVASGDSLVDALEAAATEIDRLDDEEDQHYRDLALLMATGLLVVAYKPARAARMLRENAELLVERGDHAGAIVLSDRAVMIEAGAEDPSALAFVRDGDCDRPAGLEEVVAENRELRAAARRVMRRGCTVTKVLA